MKQLLGIMFALMLAMPAHGKSKHVDTSANNLGSTFNTTFPQLIVTGVPSIAKGIFVYNGTGRMMECHANWPTAVTAPAADTGDGKYIPANSGVILDYKGVGRQVFCRCIGGTCSTGDIIVDSGLQ